MYAAKPNRTASPTALRETNIVEFFAEPIQESIKEFKVAVESSLRAYVERYHETGNLEITDDELVVEMALEGEVFTPDRALQKLLKIANTLQRIEQNSLELWSIFLNMGEQNGHKQPEHLKLQVLNKDTHSLILAIEKDVIPLIYLVPESQEETLTALKEIKEVISYFVQSFEQTIITPGKKQKEAALTMRRCLTQFIAKNQLVSMVAMEVIKSRVPLYRLAE